MSEHGSEYTPERTDETTRHERPRILGIAASLRNARRQRGAQGLIDELMAIPDKEKLLEYLRSEGQLQLQNYVTAGRKEGLPFDRIYLNLRKVRTSHGLSNSEVALAAALWAVAQTGCEIDYVSLSDFFTSTNDIQKADELLDKLLAADGWLLSTPVYFGDRGSLAQGMLDLVRAHPELHEQFRRKVYAGIAVGAKRNGGQETTLIYQLFDMINYGLLGVGNDSDTTAQYGGTGHAGDIGQMPKDDYGLNTSMGTGRRIAHVTGMNKLGLSTELEGNARVMFWVLQDRDDLAMNYVRGLVSRFENRIDATIIRITDHTIRRCIACDICPSEVDIDQVYRCIIRHRRDDHMGKLHEHFFSHDAIVPVVYSSLDSRDMVSNYQRFIERTRYLRRGDYVFTDCLTAPLVLEDMGALQNMHMRMATSLLRHHTVLAAPMVDYRRNGEFLNTAQVDARFTRFVDLARILAAGRLKQFANGNAPGVTKYNPVGYVLSSEKNRDDEKLEVRARMVKERHARLRADARLRLRDEKVKVV